MKRLFLLLLAVALAGPVAAQRGFGVRAGLNVSDMTLSAGGASYSFTSRARFHVGLAYQTPLTRTVPLFFETGLYYTGRGATLGSGLFEDMEGKVKLGMHYLQLPVMVGFHLDLGRVALQPMVGLYYGLGVGGKLTVDGVDDSLDLFKEIEIDGQRGKMLKRSDAGVRFGLNALFGDRFLIGAGYDLGFLNVAHGTTGEGKLRNGSFFLSVGYNF